MESEDELVAKARLEATLTALVETKEDLDEQSARWTVQVDAMKERLTELQDIELCALTVTRASAGAQSGVRCAVTLLNGVRRWVFLLSLIHI